MNHADLAAMSAGIDHQLKYHRTGILCLARLLRVLGIDLKENLRGGNSATHAVHATHATDVSRTKTGSFSRTHATAGAVANAAARTGSVGRRSVLGQRIAVVGEIH